MYKTGVPLSSHFCGVICALKESMAVTAITSIARTIKTGNDGEYLFMLIFYP